jgi:hypothetical protein
MKARLASLALCAGCVAAPYDVRLRARVPPSPAEVPGASVLEYQLVVVVPAVQARITGGERDSFADRVGSSLEEMLAARGIHPRRVPSGGDLHLVLIHGDRTELWVVSAASRKVYRARGDPPRQALNEVVDAMLRDLPPGDATAGPRAAPGPAPVSEAMPAPRAR